MAENLVDGLAGQIERVAGIREQFKSLRGMPNVIVEPQIALMTAELDAAKKAMGENDIPAMMQAYKSLEEYSE